ncbi:hypothetical protein AcW1_007035 [Taiwanofungus camphoratus]|nr:hypothetical protein AcV5_002841 [Antrodia cinnamomea]KAI0925099.1 hypothetical protein AcW2_005788 [Antrodia cinnamomea]KAI0929681.1 hypothetical protein AcV7_005158 [Antrodia cinnamomea]KAI0955452.1 hypothetical protein AcW1_007035 [Antrodia cinnamomea]
MSAKPVVLVVGATGTTGGSIIKALLKSDNLKAAAITRPASLSKPAVTELRSKGVEIREADVQSDSLEKLKEALSGVDVLISAVNAEIILSQKTLLAAAKKAGVKRVVPCDFGTPGARGVRDLHDMKLEIRDFIKDLGLGYTFIDVGWWMQLCLPSSSTVRSYMGPLSHEFYGAGDKKMLATNADHIGDYVAKIVVDDRTLNQYVIIWEDEVTLAEAWEIAQKVSGEGDAMKAKTVHVSREELVQRAATAKAECQRSYTPQIHAAWALSQYQISMQFLGENSLENAKALGALDVRELYPELVPMSLEEFARQYYKRGQ